MPEKGTDIWEDVGMNLGPIARQATTLTSTTLENLKHWNWILRAVDRVLELDLF